LKSIRSNLKKWKMKVSLGKKRSLRSSKRKNDEIRLTIIQELLKRFEGKFKKVANKKKQKMMINHMKNSLGEKVFNEIE